MKINRFAVAIAFMSAIVQVADAGERDIAEARGGRGPILPDRIDVSDVLRIDESASTKDVDIDTIQARDQPESDCGACLWRPESGGGVK